MWSPLPYSGRQLLSQDFSNHNITQKHDRSELTILDYNKDEDMSVMY